MTPTMNEVVTAYLDCRKGKRNTESAMDFEKRLVANLAALHGELCDGTYAIGRTRCFVTTRPKPREIWAASFRDRIVHHLVYNRIAPKFHARFSAASCACIPGRGTLYGAKRLEKQVRSATRNWSRPIYYLKLDLANFFVSISKEILYELVWPHVDDEWTLATLRQIMFHDPTITPDIRSPANIMALVPEYKSLFSTNGLFGLPIGNLSSQFLANVYMDVLDQFVDHQIKPLGYVRYVDDFILLHDDIEWLKDSQARIEAFLAERLAVRINPAKTVLQPVSRGIDFVGHVVKPWRRVPRGRLTRTAKRRVREAKPDDMLASTNSYLGLLGQSKAFYERAALCRLAQRKGHSVDGKFTRIHERKGVAQCDI